MGILKAYTSAHPQLLKSTVALATDQEFPVMRTLFNITEPLIQGIEQIRLQFPGFPSLQTPNHYIRRYRDFRQKAYQRLEAAGVFQALSEQASAVENIFLRPDLDIVKRTGSVDAITGLVEALEEPRSLVDQDFGFVYERIENLVIQLEDAVPEKASNLCLEFRIGAENDLDQINAARDRVVAMLQRGEQHFRSLYDEQMRRLSPAQSMRPPGVGGPRN